MSPATSDDIDVKEDLLNNRILRYFNLPPYLSDPPSPPSPPNSPPSTSTPTLTIHRTGQTYALSPLSAEETGLELIPASEARQFTNKDVIIYLDAVAQTKVLFHELWKLWYPLRRGEVWEESGLLERFFAAPIRLPTPSSSSTTTNTTPLSTLTKTHTHLTTRIHSLQGEMHGPRIPTTSPSESESKGLFKVSEGCASCFLIVGGGWSEGPRGVRVVCQARMLSRLDSNINEDGETAGWTDIESEESKGEKWVWKAMALAQAVRVVIRLGGEEGRFGEKGSSAYFREYYEGEGWREGFAER